ncbi:acyl-CoA dehydrogenase family protein [Streptomyces sp. CA-250714]|uniref:acyl-CoA dehydrogenase family protein n=1 Tax=Streptomyces sp. CA-250714 TaxID=3240060 RepID=UPI003D943ACC
MMTTLDTRAAPAVPNTAADILAAAWAIAPRLRARSAQIEEGRRLPADIVELVRGTGAFRMGFTEEFGGPALTSAQQTQVLEAISYGDTSAGWCAMVGMDSGLFANYLPAPAVRQMFPTLDLSSAGMLAPAGRAERVPGGYRLTGRWGFGSGIAHADWVFAGAHTYTDGEQDRSATGTPNWRVMMVPPEQVELLDTWYATGLAGSGSMDYTIDGVLVPEEHTFSFRAPRSRTGPLSTPDLQMRKMPGVPLGAARAALDQVREAARTSTDTRTGRPWADDQRVQLVLGECETRLTAVRHAVYRSLDHRWSRLEAGATQADLTAHERVDTMLARLNAFRTARSVVRRLYDLSAATAPHRSSSLDRWLRDLETMCQHFMAQDQIIQSAGAFLLGGNPRNPLVLGILD